MVSHWDPGEPVSGVHDLTCRWVCKIGPKVNSGDLPWDTRCEEDHQCWCEKKETKGG